MQHLEVSGAVRHIYIYIYIYSQDGARPAFFQNSCVVLCIVVLYCSMYCLCVNVYCTTATG